MSFALDILAGPKAFETLRQRGFDAANVDAVIGASGGPKWLALSGLDRVLFAELCGAQRTRPLHLIGSSIGSWRMACLAQRDPLAALDRFETAYIERQRYSARPSPAEVSRVSVALLDALLGENGAREILENPRAHLHVIAARCRGLAASERRGLLTAGLAIAAVTNALNRRTLRWHAERVIFDTAGDASPFRMHDMPTRHVPLTHENLRAALIASGSIPLVLEGVRIPGLDGTYRDGGVIDYHPDFDFGSGDGLVLYPHFYSRIVPGWFDKSLPWRRAGGRNFAHVLLLAPSDAFVAKLPGGRIPDRKDFYRYTESDRIRAWHAVTHAGRILGEEFAELVASGRWMTRVRPLASR